jgi:hypothetical protein
MKDRKEFRALRVWRALAVVLLFGGFTKAVLHLVFPQYQQDPEQMRTFLEVTEACWLLAFAVAYVISVWKDPRSIGTKVWQGIIWWIVVCCILRTVLDVALGSVGPQLVFMGAVFYLLSRDPLKADSQVNGMVEVREEEKSSSAEDTP